MWHQGAAPRESPDPDRVDRVERRIRRAYRIAELAVRESTVLIGHDGMIVETIRFHDRLGVPIDELLGGAPVPAGWGISELDGVPIAAGDHPALVALRSGKQTDAVVRYISPGGESIDLRLLSYPVRGDASVAVDVFVTDHDRRLRDRELLEAQETRFRTMTDMLPVAVWESTPDGEITYVNPKFTELTGREVADTPSLPMLEIVHPDDVLAVMDAATKAVDTTPYHSEYRLVHVDGSSRWVTSRMSIIVDDRGKMSGFAGAIEDIDDLHRSERRSARLAGIVEAAGEAIAIVEGGAATYVNRSCALLLERTDPAFVTDRTTHTFLTQFREQYVTEVDASLKSTGVWTGDVSLVDVDGEATDLAVTVRAEVEDGVIVRTVVMARDIGDRKRREDRLAHDAVHDPLTGLANRHGLERAVAALVDDPIVDVFFVDIDHFKEVNDTLGHAAGDAVLVEVGARVRDVVGGRAVVDRVGGDEMLIVRPVGNRAAADLAGRLVDSIAATPFGWNDQTWPVTVTVGAARGSVSDLDGLTVSADAALYRAKAAGRATWRTDAE